MQMGINFAMKPSLKRGHIDIAALFAGYPGRVGCYYGTKTGPSYSDILARNREALGPELVANGDFAAGLDGWVDASTAPAFASASLGVGTLTSNGNTGRLRQAISTTPGAWCRLQFRVVKSNAVARLSIGTTAGGTDIRVATAMTNGVNCVDFVSTTSTTWINWHSSADFSIDDVSAREITDWSKLILFDDANGTVPVFSVFQSSRGRGLLLDASQGLVRGAEQLTNGGFSGGASGWTVTGNDATHIATFAGGTLRYQSDTTSPALLITQTGALVSGKVYEIVTNVSSYTSGSMKSDSFGGVILASRAGENRVIATATTTVFGITRSTTNVDMTIDSISVRELPGNHMVQPTAAARGELSARYNLLTGTDTLSGWTGSNVSVTPNAVLAPDGSMTGASLAFSGAGYLLSPSASVGAAISGNLGLYVKSMGASLTTVRIQKSDGSERVAINVNFSTGAYNSSGGAASTTDLVDFSPLDGGWYKLTVRGSLATSTSATIFISTSVAGQDLAVWRPDFRLTADVIPSIPAYQRVTSATDYDDVGFPVYWRGQTDDWAKSHINPNGATKALVMWAGQKMSDALLGTLVETSVSSSVVAGTIAVFAPGSDGQTGYRTRSAGTIGDLSGTSQDASHPAPGRDAVRLEGRVTATSLNILTVNGVQAYRRTDTQGDGSYTEQDVFFCSRAGTQHFANIREFAPPLILFQPTADPGLSASQITALDKAYAKAAGVAL